MTGPDRFVLFAVAVVFSWALANGLSHLSWIRPWTSHLKRALLD